MPSRIHSMHFSTGCHARISSTTGGIALGKKSAPDVTSIGMLIRPQMLPHVGNRPTLQCGPMVAVQYDMSGRTARVAASLAFDQLCLLAHARTPCG